MAGIRKSQFPPRFDVTINGFDFEFVLEDSSGMHGETQSYYPTDDNLSADITFSTKDVIERDGRMEEFNFNDGDTIVADFTVDESDSAYGIHDWEQLAEQYFANADDMISAFKNWVSSVANKSAKKSQPKPASFSDMVNKQRNKNNGVAKSGSLVDELTKLHAHLDKAWDELADALNLSSDSYFPELRGLAGKLFQYDELVGNLCMDIKELLDKCGQRE